MMFYYATPALDYFDGMVPVDEYVKGYHPDIVGVITAAMLAAKAMQKQWDGDIRGREFYVFALPDPDSARARIGLVWKQDNDGGTFVASPVHLDWLSNYLITPKKD